MTECMHQIRISAVKIAFHSSMEFWAREDPVSARHRSVVSWIEKKDRQAMLKGIATVMDGARIW